MIVLNYIYFVVLKNNKTMQVLLCYNRGNTGYLPNYTCNCSNTNEINKVFVNFKSYL